MGLSAALRRLLAAFCGPRRPLCPEASPRCPIVEHRAGSQNLCRTSSPLLVALVCALLPCVLMMQRAAMSASSHVGEPECEPECGPTPAVTRSAIYRSYDDAEAEAEEVFRSVAAVYNEEVDRSAIYNSEVEEVDPRLHCRAGEYLDAWIELPVLGGCSKNCILLRKAVDARAEIDVPIIMEEPGLEVWFHSRRSGETIRMVALDILKVCPAKQLWPWCAYCRKFLFPAAEHRCSLSHHKCKYYIEFKGRKELCDPNIPSQSLDLMACMQGCQLRI